MFLIHQLGTDPVVAAVSSFPPPLFPALRFTDAFLRGIVKTHLDSNTIISLDLPPSMHQDAQWRTALSYDSARLLHGVLQRHSQPLICRVCPSHLEMIKLK